MTSFPLKRLLWLVKTIAHLCLCVRLMFFAFMWDSLPQSEYLRSLKTHFVSSGPLNSTKQAQDYLVGQHTLDSGVSCMPKVRRRAWSVHTIYTHFLSQSPWQPLIDVCLYFSLSVVVQGDLWRRLTWWRRWESRWDHGGHHASKTSSTTWKNTMLRIFTACHFDVFYFFINRMSASLRFKRLFLTFSFHCLHFTSHGIIEA